MASNIIGGIEGGATHSNCVVVNADDGKIVGSAKGLGTNHHLLGMEECWNRLADLLDRAKDDAGMSRDEPLMALGLSLSGCEEEQSNARLADGLKNFAPRLANQIVAGSDVEGSAAAATAAVPESPVGVALIAGTGHNCLRVGPATLRRQCGGWGNILGDEGSAYMVALRAVKTCFDDLDSFKPSPHPIERLWNAVKEHFKIEKQADILDYFYKNFDKAFIASLCKKVAELANDGDKLSQHVFTEVGADLARSVYAVLYDLPPELSTIEIPVLCVGSLWLSWPLLRPGFEAQLNTAKAHALQLLRLAAPPGLCAAVLAVQRLGLAAPKAVEALGRGAQVLYEYDGKAGAACGCKGKGGR